MAYKYSYQGDEESIAKAVLLDAPISTKHSIEICSRIRNKKIDFAKNYLESVIEKKAVVRFSRFTEGAGHKTAMGPGKYPLKAAGIILKVIKSAESNASDKGLSKDLIIKHASAQRASTPWRHGRLRRRKMKRTHIELVIKEITQKIKQENKTKEDVKKRNNSNKKNFKEGLN
ncbi:50S ribosomal protein L22 [Candidatus Woesearchaeota archaeon]|jgi:large subunit ribosomal protein L22|nr:50S ribosomal protein L22 [Candidatus Woesearchaeota archaeon]|tara:strand:- start:704 stop:1222 length:519 start_codon:yes stop_codon:yes gene_type:complete